MTTSHYFGQGSPSGRNPSTSRIAFIDCGAAVRIATAPGYRGTAADAHAAAAERDAAGPFEVVAADDARHRDHVAFARFDLVEQFLLAGQPEPASGLDLDALRSPSGLSVTTNALPFEQPGMDTRTESLGTGFSSCAEPVMLIVIKSRAIPYFICLF